MSESEKSVVDEVIAGRRGVYGNPEETMPRFAQICSGIIGAPVTAEQATLCLIGYKLMRASVCPEYSDNSDDIEGYLDIFRLVVGKNMIHARTVDEFLEKRKLNEADIAREDAINEQIRLDAAKTFFAGVHGICVGNLTLDEPDPGYISIEGVLFEQGLSNDKESGRVQHRDR